MNRRNAMRRIGAFLTAAGSGALTGQAVDIGTEIPDAQVMALIPDIASAADASASKGSLRAGDSVVRVVRVQLSSIRDPQLVETVNSYGTRIEASIRCTEGTSKGQIVVNPDGTTS